MATFNEVLAKAISKSNGPIISVNRSLMEAAKETKKKPAFVKVAVTEELARGLMMNKTVAFIVYMDGDELNAIAEQIDNENSQAV